MPPVVFGARYILPENVMSTESMLVVPGSP
jgi:hypothetical protein